MKDEASTTKLPEAQSNSNKQMRDLSKEEKSPKPTTLQEESKQLSKERNNSMPKNSNFGEKRMSNRPETLDRSNEPANRRQKSPLVKH